MSGSATMTVGSTLRYAEDDGSTVEVLVEGQWLSGGIAGLDGDGVMLATGEISTLVRLSAISVVRVHAGAQAAPATAVSPVPVSPVAVTPVIVDPVAVPEAVETVETVEAVEVTPVAELDAMWSAAEFVPEPAGPPAPVDVDPAEAEPHSPEPRHVLPEPEPAAPQSAEFVEAEPTQPALAEADEQPLAQVHQLWTAQAPELPDDEAILAELTALETPDSEVSEPERVRTVETDDWRAMLVSLREEAGSLEPVPVKRSGWRIGSSR